MENTREQRPQYRKKIIMGIFFKRKKQLPPETIKNNKVSGWLASVNLKIKSEFATSLSNYEKRLSRRQKIWSFAVFFVFINGYTIAMMLHDFQSKQTGKPSYFSHNSITLPQSIKLPDSLDVQLMTQLRKLDSTVKKTDSITK